MSAWYLLSGSVRLVRCPEVDAILDELRDLRGDEFEVLVTDINPGAIELTFRGGSEFTDEGADDLVTQAQRAVRNVGAQDLRDSEATRNTVANQLSRVQVSLDAMLIERPRRRILRNAPASGGES